MTISARRSGSSPRRRAATLRPVPEGACGLIELARGSGWKKVPSSPAGSSPSSSNWPAMKSPAHFSPGEPARRPSKSSAARYRPTTAGSTAEAAGGVGQTSVSPDRACGGSWGSVCWASARPWGPVPSSSAAALSRAGAALSSMLRLDRIDISGVISLGSVVTAPPPPLRRRGPPPIRPRTRSCLPAAGCGGWRRTRGGSRRT